MTEHSTEELKRQYDAALSRRMQASDAERAAMGRLCDAYVDKALADLAAVGLVPGVEIVILSWINRKPEPGRYVFGGAERGRWAEVPRLYAYPLKKDGTPAKKKQCVAAELIALAEVQP